MVSWFLFSGCLSALHVWFNLICGHSRNKQPTAEHESEEEKGNKNCTNAGHMQTRSTHKISNYFAVVPDMRYLWLDRCILVWYMCDIIACFAGSGVIVFSFACHKFRFFFHSFRCSCVHSPPSLDGVIHTPIWSVVHLLHWFHLKTKIKEAKAFTSNALQMPARNKHSVKKVVYKTVVSRIQLQSGSHMENWNAHFYK